MCVCKNMHKMWNNKDITIERNSIFWKAWFDKGIHFVQDLVDKNKQFPLAMNLMTNTK